MKITEYMARGDGARAVGVDCGDVQVLVTPSSQDANKRARQVAQRIVDVELDAMGTQLALDGLGAANASLATTIRELRAKLDDSEARLERALSGRRVLLGPALVRPAVDGDWSGAVFLMDPDTQERGMSLLYPSMRALRASHPELWPVKVTADGGLVVDAWGAE